MRRLIKAHFLLYLSRFFRFVQENLQILHILLEIRRLINNSLFSIGGFLCYKCR